MTETEWLKWALRVSWALSVWITLGFIDALHLMAIPTGLVAVINLWAVVYFVEKSAQAIVPGDGNADGFLG